MSSEGDASLSQSQPARIQSFVIFDLETTGLPSARDPTKITELAMHAISRQNLLSNKSYEELRVFHKLVVCINPEKPIHPEAARITGLNNDLLKYENKFCKNTYLSVYNFLERLPRPVCLIAHNGDKFDFPILQSELHAIGEKLHGDLLCVDSLRLFKEMIPKGSYAPALQSVQPNNGAPPKKKPKTSNTLKGYKLDDLHKFLVAVRKRENAHNAEADVDSLTKCILARSESFIGLADDNAILFNGVKKMW